MKNIKSLLEKPGLESRPWAMWLWNASITREKLVNQLDSFIEKGFGGVAIKPSRDMAPSFLSKEFFELFKVALDRALAAKIEIRLAEDFSMPWSGVFKSAAAVDDRLRARSIHLEFTEIIPEKKAFEMQIHDPATTIILAAKLQHGMVQLSQVKKIPLTPEKGLVSWTPVSGDWQLMVFRICYVVDPVCGYVPSMFNTAVAEWYCGEIGETLKKAFTKYMPAPFKGFVHELPAYIIPSSAGIPWDETISAAYQTKFKKKLVDILPALFLNVDTTSAKLRTQAYTFINQLAHERFTIPLEAWCKKNRLTQWVLFPERSNMQQAVSSLNYCGAIPDKRITSPVGIQNLDGVEENTSLLHAVTDMNTMQFRRETITVIGRNRSGNGAALQQLKTEVDRVMLAGPTRILLDGCFFNIDRRSYVKTPHNPAWYSPDWKHMNVLCSYVARMTELTVQNRFSRPIAVLRPVSSILADFNAGTIAVDPLYQGASFVHETVRELQRLNLSFDILDEDLLSGCVIHAAGDFVASGKMRKGNYQLLVIPYARLIPVEVLRFIESLVEKGGRVLFIGEAPQGTLEDGSTTAFAGRMKKLLQSKKGKVLIAPVKGIETLCSTIDTLASATITGKKCADIMIQHMAREGMDIYYFHNSSVLQDHFVTIEIPEQKNTYIADCSLGELYELHTIEKKNKKCRFGFTFLPGQTSVIIASSLKQQATTPGKGKKYLATTVGAVPRSFRVVLKEQWQFAPDSLNMLPLAGLNTRIGLSREFGSYSLFYEANFEVKDIPPLCILAVGQLAGAASLCGRLAYGEKPMEVAVNGIRIVESKIAPALPGGAGVPSVPVMPAYNAGVLPVVFGDTTCTYDIREHLHKGPNRISFRTFGGTLDPLAIVYPPLIAGKFSIVKGPSGWILSSLPPYVGQDSWTKYGYPYLSGSGIYKQIFELPGEYNRLILRMSQVSGSVDVAVNNKQLGTLNWHPMEIDITEACDTKRNEIALRVVNTLDNVLRMNGRTSGIADEVYVDVY